MPKRNVKYGLSLLFRDYLVVSATMMRNKCFLYIHTHTHTHIYIYICACVCMCVYIYMNSVEWEWGNH